jgi:hypothetical protein
LRLVGERLVVFRSSFSYAFERELRHGSRSDSPILLTNVF